MNRASPRPSHAQPETEPKASRLRLILLALALALPFSSGCAQGSGGVTRMAEGVRYEGRYISPEAYAAYLLGVERETRGDHAGALRAYLEAHAEDPDSPEVWARIGTVRCLATPAAQGPGAARSAFERGIRQDPEYYANYFERARCTERAQHFNAALPDALIAIARRPHDESVNLLVARLLEALGRGGEARTWLESFQLYRRSPSPAVAHALERLRQGARTAREPAGPANPKGAEPFSSLLGEAGASARPAQSAPDQASAAGLFQDLRDGRAARARERAAAAFDADPSNADAWVATLVACDALHDDACFEATLSALKTPSLTPSRTALGYLRELLSRRTGFNSRL